MLAEAVALDISVVVAPLRPDLQNLVVHDARLGERLVIPAADGGGQPSITTRITSMLEAAVYRRRGPAIGDQPIQYNFARRFPLHHAFLTRYFHVDRSSVRDLLRTFENRNGARLWCSVRRSGKTTACLDLEDGAGRALVVSQTCEAPSQTPGGDVFYQGVLSALSDGSQLPNSFLDDILTRCNVALKTGYERYVFVLDEYEILFGRLRSALRTDPDLRYTVVQPLLNQLVAFTRDNLLVLLGQVPDAHYILMDHNQLSAYLEQDAFPLFRHRQGSTDTEFCQLLKRVLTDKISFRQDFSDACFAETSGHPFLTVKLLIELVDWLIECERPLSSLSLDSSDFAAFSSSKLTQSHLAVSAEYSFFTNAISAAIGRDGRRSMPWLHAIYSCLRAMALAAPGAIRISRSDFSYVVRELGLSELGFTPEGLLSTGAQANFLRFDEDYVWAKIRLLGRIAGVTRPRVET
jgi:hypothetical protein